MNHTYLIYFFMIFFGGLLTAGCEKINEGDSSFVNNVPVPANLNALFEITQDNSGNVTITPNGEGASYFDIFIGDGTADPVRVAAGKSTTHRYNEGTYSVRIVGYNIAG